MGISVASIGSNIFAVGIRRVDNGPHDSIDQFARPRAAFVKWPPGQRRADPQLTFSRARRDAAVGARHAIPTHYCLMSDFTQRLYQSSMSSPDAADGSGKPKIGGNGPSGPGCPAAMPGANASSFPAPLLLGVKTRSLKLRPLRGPGCVEAADCAEGTGKMERDDEPIGKMEPDFRSDL